MKKRLNHLFSITVAAALVILSVLSLASCSVIDDFQRLGLLGWLNTGVKKGETTATPTSGVTDSPSSTPGSSSADLTIAPFPTVLPVIPRFPDMQTLLSSLELDLTNGRSFIMYISDTPNVYALYGETVEKQNSLISEKFGFTISSHKESAETINKLVSGEDYFADLLYIPLSEAVSLANKGLLIPFNEGQGNGNEELFYITNRSDTAYYAVPSFSVPYESNIVIYCNTDILARMGKYTDITQVTSNGSFDIGLFSQMLNISSLPEGVCPIVSRFDSGKLEGILSAAQGYTESSISESVLDALTVKSSEDALSEFYTGKALFMIADISDIRELYDSYDSYAILPMPKADASDKDYPSLFDSDTLYVYAIPKSAVNLSAAKSYIKARCFASKYQFRYEFAESLYSYYLRQESSTAHLGVSLFSGLCDICENTENTDDTGE